MLEFGFLLDCGDKKFALAPLPIQHESDSDSEYLGRIFRQLFLSSEKNWTKDEGLWSSDRGARDFSRGASWFLMQDVWSGPRRYEGDPPTIQQEQNTQILSRDGKKQPLFSSGIRWEAFARWAQFTGLARRDAEGLIPDPSRAVSDAISDMNVEGKVAVRVFMENLASEIPVIDGGAYWLEVRAKMVHQDKELGLNRVSSSLTHALKRLEERGRILIRNEADAPDKMSLSPAYRGERVELISHVEVVP